MFSETEHRQLLSHVRSGRKNLHLDPTLQDLLRTLFGDTPRREIADRFFMVFMEEPMRTLRSGRSILQLLGTEWGRGLADDAWVKALAAELTPGSKYVVPDLRFPNEGAITRLVGALLLEQNDEWAVQRARYMTLETMAPMSDNPLVSLPAVAA